MTKDKLITPGRSTKPPITLNIEDHDRLSQLARAAGSTMPDLVPVLTEELERAQVVADVLPERIVRMGSEVAFRDDSTGRIETVTLVYPGDADIAQRRISIMTPIGTALIGLSLGDSITWETRSGELRLLTVLRVRQPEPA